MIKTLKKQNGRIHWAAPEIPKETNISFTIVSHYRYHYIASSLRITIHQNPVRISRIYIIFYKLILLETISIIHREDRETSTILTSRCCT